MTAGTEIISLGEEHIQPVADALSRGFFDDPLQVYTLPDAVDRRRHSPGMFASFLRYGLLFGDTYTTRGSEGGAVWLPPDDWHVTEERMDQSGMMSWPASIGEAATERFGGVMAFLEPYHEADAPPRHWYLAVLGVDSSLQGRGIGSALVAPITAHADQDGLACYLETANEKNLAFYQRSGFAVTRDVTDPASGLRLWTMLRQPSAQGV